MIPWTKALVDDFGWKNSHLLKMIPRSGLRCGLAIRANGRNLSSCFRSVIMMTRWTNCLMLLSLVRFAQRGSILLGPLLFTVQERTGRKSWDHSSWMVPHVSRVALILEPDFGSFIIWSARLRNVSRSLRLRSSNFRWNGLVNLQPLMHLNGAVPRKLVLVFLAAGVPCITAT